MNTLYKLLIVFDALKGKLTSHIFLRLSISVCFILSLCFYTISFLFMFVCSFFSFKLLFCLSVNLLLKTYFFLFEYLTHIFLLLVRFYISVFLLKLTQIVRSAYALFSMLHIDSTVFLTFAYSLGLFKSFSYFIHPYTMGQKLKQKYF
jgi:hypothetical protein